MKNLKLGFSSQETHLESFGSNLVSFLNDSFQNGIGFQNENAFKNEFKAMIKITCKGCFEALKELS